MVDRTSQVRRGNRSSGAPLLIRAVNLMNRLFEEVGDGRSFAPVRKYRGFD
jgi:hypothetical protein